ncbi:chorismate mutase [Candidatus Peregrinibacteria bacterium]|nr:chorismate mutase [Candidatus Peregrinibacteria bacterium]
MNDLATNRAEINKIDDKILALLCKRAEKCLEIKEIKAANKIPTRDKDREEEILKKCRGKYELEIYRKILEESRKLQL